MFSVSIKATFIINILFALKIKANQKQKQKNWKNDEEERELRRSNTFIEESAAQYVATEWWCKGQTKSRTNESSTRTLTIWAYSQLIGILNE